MHSISLLLRHSYTIVCPTQIKLYKFICVAVVSLVTVSLNKH